MKNPIKNEQTGLLTFEIEVEGKPIPETFQVFGIKVVHQINKISRAEITILDGSVVDGDFEISSSSDFDPGKIIEIKAGYDLSNRSIFSGVISGQKININSEIGSKLIVECSNLKGEVTYDTQTLSDKIKSPSKSALTLTYGINIFELNAGLKDISSIENRKDLVIWGKVKTQGTAGVSTTDFITLQNLGKKFSGNHFVSSITQEISEGDWTSVISFGLSPSDLLPDS